MKVNHDCVRDLLMVLENILIYDDTLKHPHINLNQIGEKMPEYNMADIAYSAWKLSEARFINAQVIDSENTIQDILFASLAYDGHKYLDHIRDQNVWDKVKNTLDQHGGSLPFATVNVIAQRYLLQNLGIN